MARENLPDTLSARARSARVRWRYAGRRRLRGGSKTSAPAIPQPANSRRLLATTRQTRGTAAVRYWSPDRRGQGIGRTGFIIDATLQRVVCPRQRIEGIAHVEIDDSRCCQRGTENCGRDGDEQRLMLRQQALGHLDLGMREICTFV